MSWEHEAAVRVPALLEGWLRAGADSVSREYQPTKADLVISAGDRLFVAEVRAGDDIATLSRAAQVLDTGGSSPDVVKLVVVPYMGPKARAWAADRGLSWIDLSGNAEIRARDLCIVVSGERNRYAAPGRPSNPFTPRFSRVARALMVHPNRWWKQIDIAQEVSLPAGTVSKAVQRLSALDLLEHNSHDEIRARAPAVLIESWAQRYRFDEHSIRRYHAVARSGVEALRALGEAFSGLDLTWAATGLSAAWVYASFADFRLNTLFVDQHPRNPEELGLRPVDRGENTLLVVPRDDGVFYGRTHRGLWCTHPVQVYLDLGGHSERAADAAQALAASPWMAWRE